MRDNHQGYTEILSAYQRDGLFFGAIRLSFPTEAVAFEFGIEKNAYSSLRKILQFRPFDNTPGVSYRYFFTGRYGRKKLDTEPVTIGIRIEQDDRSKVFDFDCPTSLASNLLWFQSLTDFSQASTLKRLDQ